MDRLAGKVALITGGASGLGRQAAIRMTEEGAKVVITDINAELGAQTAEEIGGDILFLEHDVTHEAGWQAVIEVALTRHGRLDVVVNGAGIVSVGNVEEMAYDEWKRVQAVNSDSVFLGCKYGVAAIKQTSKDAETGGGSIINISSVSGLIGGHNLAAYNASKGAVITLTKAMAVELAAEHIRVNALCPVAGETPMLVDFMGGDTPEKRAQFVDSVPMGRLAVPEDIANAALYLASDEGAFITGVDFRIDGGRAI